MDNVIINNMPLIKFITITDTLRAVITENLKRYIFSDKIIKLKISTVLKSIFIQNENLNLTNVPL